MDQHQIHQAAERLEALDLSQEVKTLAELQTIATEVEAAQDAASRRIREIGDILASQRIDSEAIADALVAGQSPSEAATAGPSADSLRDEKQALKEGLSNLNNRLEAVRREADALRDEAYRKIAIAARPLADIIESDLRAAAEHIVTAYAAASALHDVTRGFINLRGMANAAAQAVTGARNILGDRERVQTPTEVIQALTPIAKYATALKARPAQSYVKI